MNAAEACTEVITEFAKQDQERDVWDELPMILVVAAPRPDDPRTIVAEVGIPPKFWEDRDPVQAMWTIANVVAMPWAPAPPVDLEVGDEILGVILRTEGWALKGDTEEEREAVLAYVQGGGRISEHPNGREVRSWLATWGDGGAVSTLVRGEAEPEFKDNLGEGRVPEVLNLLLDAFRARYTPA